MRHLAQFVGAISLVACVTAQAQNYPSKPIRVVIPYPAGGAGDVIARSVGAKLTEQWGQQILVDNRPGAGGNIGTESVARAPADGYTLLLGTDIQMSINPHIFKQLPYDPERDFAPISAAYFAAFVLSAHPSVPANTLPELIAHLKSRPGKYNYASAGNGSPHHLAMEWLKVAAGVDVVHIPYKGSGQILPDLMAGQVQLAYMGLSPAIPHVKSGKLKVIAVGTSQRVEAIPDLATISETYPGIEAGAIWSFFAPAGTPRDIVLRLNSEINRIAALPDVKERMLAQGLYPLGGSPEDLGSRTKSDTIKWGKVVQQIGFKAE
jgi:tripartite-type tricarboxylate transporter receptor subunit TctC